MEKLLTSEEKKYLGKMCRYLGSLGMTDGLIDLDIDGDTNLYVDDYDWNYFANNYSAEIPELYVVIVKKILQYIEENDLLNDNLPDEELNSHRLEITINCPKKEISVSQYYSYYDLGDSSQTQWTSEDEGVNEIFEILKQEVSSSKKNVLSLDYNGGGDSGYLESQFQNGEDVPTDIEDWCYSELESHHGGWEINEGSQGTFHFNIDNNTIILNHTYNTEEYVNDTIWEEEF